MLAWYKMGFWVFFSYFRDLILVMIDYEMKEQKISKRLMIFVRWKVNHTIYIEKEKFMKNQIFDEVTIGLYSEEKY